MSRLTKLHDRTKADILTQEGREEMLRMRAESVASTNRLSETINLEKSRGILLPNTEPVPFPPLPTTTNARLLRARWDAGFK